MSRHLIYRQKIMLNLSGSQEAFALQEKVSRLMKNELADSLESALDRAFPPDRIVRIDTLQLDMGTISLQNFENEFKAGFIEALTKSLSEKNETFSHAPRSADKKEELLSKPQSLKETLLFFLKKGYLPWYSADWKINDWEAEILDNFSEEEYRALIKWLKDELHGNPVVIDRLVLQFSGKFIGTLLMKIRPDLHLQWPLIFEDFRLILDNLLESADLATHSSDFRYGADSHGTISEKIGQFALRVWLDDHFNQPVLKTLELLLAYFGVGSTHVANLKSNRVADGIRTPIVKDAFETIFIRGDTAENPEERSSTPSKPAGKNVTSKADSWDKEAEEQIDDNKAGVADEKSGAVKKQKARDKEAEDPTLPNGDVGVGASAGDTQAAAQAFLKKDEKKDRSSAANKSKTDQGATITAHNCGVVLLNPFFKKYFEDLHLTQHNLFVSEAARGRAVLLLNYLVTGETAAAEYDLALQKILCGYPSDETLAASIKLTRKEKAESESLLKAVMEYWEPLHNTSVAGFRESFLRRAGNLELRESGWLLKVEQKTLDILLGKLPWGFSTIRLPWMKDLLSVDWY